MLILYNHFSFLEKPRLNLRGFRYILKGYFLQAKRVADFFLEFLRKFVLYYFQYFFKTLTEIECYEKNVNIRY